MEIDEITQCSYCGGMVPVHVSVAIPSGCHMFVDESYEKDAPFIALTGVIVPNDKWKELNTKLNALRKETFDVEDFNLKLIRRQRDDVDRRWSQLSEEEKSDFTKDFHALLQGNVTIIVALIDSNKMERKYLNTYFRTAYSFLLERFEYFLRDFENCYGSVVMDHAKNSPEINSLKNLHRDDLRDGVRVWHGTKKTYEDLGHWKGMLLNQEGREPLIRIIGNLIFEKDEDNNFLQIADLVASAFASEYNRKIDKFSTLTKNY